VATNDALSLNNDLTVTIDKDDRTVMSSTAASDARSTMAQPDCGKVNGQKPLSKVLDTAALAAALPCATSTMPGSAFAGYNFATTFTKSETGKNVLIARICCYCLLSFNALTLLVN